MMDYSLGHLLPAQWILKLEDKSAKPIPRYNAFWENQNWGKKIEKAISGMWEL